MFVADALAAWLIGLLADAGRKKLITLVLGGDQQRALRQAATAAIESTAMELASSGDDEAGQLAMVLSGVFREPTAGAPPAGRATVLEALQAGIAERLSVLDDATVTGAGQSAAGVLGVAGDVLAETLARHLVREIMVRGSRGGPLFPLASQLNDDVTHLQSQRLEGMIAQLADQVKALAAPGATTVASHPVQLLPRPAFLVGREELLAEVDTWLTAGDDPGPRLVALCGLGGAGKTSVAVEYAHRHLVEVEVAWQFAAEDPTALAAGFGELAAQLGARGVADARDPVVSAHAMLAAFPAPWLLIFDNAADMASVAAFLPPAGLGRVLITSQNPNWLYGQALNVPVLDIEVAAAFLVNRTDDPDQQAATELAGELGGLPLALEQAAAYVQATGDSLAGYLASFRQRRTDLLARGEPTGYSGTVATTWRLAFEHLEQAAPGAVGLLRLLACCAPDAIPLRLLLEPRPGLVDPVVAQVLVPLVEDQLAAKDAIAALRRHSLISPPADGVVSVHRLVQAVTIAQMPARLATAWRRAAAAVIEAALPDDSVLPENWPVFAALLPHAQAALTDASGGMWRIAKYLGWSGSYAAARDLFQRVLDAYMRALGPEHPETLTVRCDLAHYIGEAGDAADARDQFAALLPVFERVLGAEHPETLSTRGYLARWTGLAGDPAGARDQYAALLPIDERVSGAEHRETLAVRANLAYNTGLAGDAAGARDQYAALLPVHERLFGAEHRETLNIRANLARWTGLAGDATGAHSQFAALLPIDERVLGAEHPETLKARGNLARWTGEAGDAAGAHSQFVALLPAFGRVLGAEHPATLAARGYLVRWIREADGSGN